MSCFKSICMLTWVAFVLLHFSCKEEAPDISSEPTLNIQDVVTSLPGETMQVGGVISDPAGIVSVRLEYEEWSLSKTINLKEVPTQYDFKYQFKIPATASAGSHHSMIVTATNQGGFSTSKEVNVRLTADNEAPVITVVNPPDGSTYISGLGSEFTLHVQVTDNQEIATLKIVGGGIYEEIMVNANKYSFEQELDFTVSGAIPFLITATDVTGNVSSVELLINIEESLLFPKMYLADVANDEELNSDLFGVPMLIDNAPDEENLGKVFVARYYNAQADTEIRFIPQKGSFAPFTFGRAAENQLEVGKDATVSPIVLKDVGYYEIIIDLTQLSYTITPYEPSDEPFEYVLLIGTGVDVNGQSTCESNSADEDRCWHFASGKQLTQDSGNPYRYTAQVTLYDAEVDGDNGFILGANEAGWSPFWRFDDGSSPEAAIPGGGTNFVFTPEAAGTYMLEFDTHLNRIRLIQ